MPKESTEEEILDIDKAIEYLREIAHQEVEDNLDILRRDWNNHSLWPKPKPSGFTAAEWMDQYECIAF